jgi:hypothetical protein
VEREEILKKLRGWFPQEPYLKGIHAKVNSENKPQPPKAIETLYSGSATQSIRPLIVIWLVLDSLLGYLIIAGAWDFGAGYYPIPVVIWMISGLVLGAVLGVKQTQRIVQKLSRDFQYRSRLGEVVYSFPIFLLSVPVYAVIMLYYPNLSLAGLVQFLVSGFALSTAVVVSKYVLFSAYEKKENMTIVQTVKGGGLLVIPQPPDAFDGGYEARNWTFRKQAEAPEQ